MRGLPAWILALMVGLTVVLIIVGWEDRHESGILPFIMGIVFAVFTLAAIGGRLRGESR